MRSSLVVLKTVERTISSLECTSLLFLNKMKKKMVTFRRNVVSKCEIILLISIFEENSSNDG